MPLKQVFDARADDLGDFVPNLRHGHWRAARCFELFGTYRDARELLFEDLFSLVRRHAADTLGEQVGYVVELLHELPDFDGEMFVIAYCSSRIAATLPLLAHPSCRDGFRAERLMLAP